MPHIKLHGVVFNVIVTQLDRISIKRAFSIQNLDVPTAKAAEPSGTVQLGLFGEPLYADKSIYCCGALLGKIDGEEYQASSIALPQGYLVHARLSPVDWQYPLYVSTSASLLRNRQEYAVWLTYTIKDKPYMKFVDNSLVLHTTGFNAITQGDCRGEITARKDLADKKPRTIILDGNETPCYECDMNFGGRFQSAYGIRGEIMELDGTFKLKPVIGTATRNGEPYKLRGDWEAVINGHVTAEVDSPAIIERWIERTEKNERKTEINLTQSLVRISAEGELVV